METSWLERHRQTIGVIGVAIAFLSLGFTIGIRFDRSFGDSARSNATLAHAQKIAEECIDLMQRKKPAADPTSDNKPN